MRSEVAASGSAVPGGGLVPAPGEAGFAPERAGAVDQVIALEAQCRRLQVLVGELLVKNQALRLQLARVGGELVRAQAGIEPEDG